MKRLASGVQIPASLPKGFSMDDLELKLNGVYTTLIDGIGAATIVAGAIYDLRIKKKVYKLLEDEAKHFAQFRIKLFDLLNE